MYVHYSPIFSSMCKPKSPEESRLIKINSGIKAIINNNNNNNDNKY